MTAGTEIQFIGFNSLNQANKWLSHYPQLIDLINWKIYHDKIIICFKLNYGLI